MVGTRLLPVGAEVTVRAAGAPLLVRVPDAAGAPSAGERVHLSLPPEHLIEVTDDDVEVPDDDRDGRGAQARGRPRAR